MERALRPRKQPVDPWTFTVMLCVRSLLNDWIISLADVHLLFTFVEQSAVRCCGPKGGSAPRRCGATQNVVSTQNIVEHWRFRSKHRALPSSC